MYLNSCSMDLGRDKIVVRGGQLSDKSIKHVESMI